MGSRNLERITIQERRREGETVSDMRRSGWKIQAHCPHCRINFNMSLDPIICIHGPMFRLWGKSITCPNDACRRPAIMAAKAPGMDGFQALLEPARPAAPTAPRWMIARGLAKDDQG